MSRLRVHGFAISFEGFGADPDQSLENPLGIGGIGLHEWAFATRTLPPDVRAGGRLDRRR
jgi:hypothetical protein